MFWNIYPGSFNKDKTWGVGSACDHVLQVSQLPGHCFQNAGVGGTPPRSQMQLGGGAALAAAEEDKRPPAAESKIAAERNAPGCAKEMFLPQVSLLSEVNKANLTSSLCCSITLTSLCSEGRMVDSGKERKS